MRKAILEAAVQIASEEGLEGLTIGRLAQELGFSKSGVFAHFGSKADLQIATVAAARRVFLDEVIGSARADGGVDALLSLTDAWLDYMEREVFRGGCFFVAASTEFDGRPGPVRDEVAAFVSEWLMALEAAIQDAQDTGDVPASIDPRQLAFELHSLGMGANWAFQLYHDGAAFERARSAIRERVSVAPAPDATIAALERSLAGDQVAVDEGVDEGAARRTLRGQIARLERELASMFPEAKPRDELEWKVGARGGPRVLDIEDLETLRDDLATRVDEVRRAFQERAEAQAQNRALIDEMVADPDKHKWVRVSNEDIGEPGCKHFHTTPRLGLVGMLMGWWRVKVSSGCP